MKGSTWSKQSFYLTELCWMSLSLYRWLGCLPPPVWTHGIFHALQRGNEARCSKHRHHVWGLPPPHLSQLHLTPRQKGERAACSAQALGILSYIPCLCRKLINCACLGVEYPEVSVPCPQRGQQACHHVRQPGGLYLVQVSVRKDILSSQLKNKCTNTEFLPLLFRHHTYKKTDHKNIELTEVGPRFEMKCKYWWLDLILKQQTEHRLLMLLLADTPAVLFLLLNPNFSPDSFNLARFCPQWDLNHLSHLVSVGNGHIPSTCCITATKLTVALFVVRDQHNVVGNNDSGFSLGSFLPPKNIWKVSVSFDTGRKKCSS